MPKEKPSLTGREVFYLRGVVFNLAYRRGEFYSIDAHLAYVGAGVGTQYSCDSKASYRLEGHNLAWAMGQEGQDLILLNSSRLLSHESGEAECSFLVYRRVSVTGILLGFICLNIDAD